MEMCQLQFVKPYKMINGKMMEDVLNKKDEKMFMKLLTLGSVGNPHAWGYFNNKIKQRFSGAYKNKQLHDVIGQSFVVGHNRFATKGDKSKNRNNHPFSSKRFTWVHNGILDNDDELRKKYDIQTKGIVDSAVIGHVIEKHLTDNITIAKSIALAMEEIEGDYSIFIHDKKTKKLYYFRNSMRSFYVRLYKKRIGSVTDRYVMVGSTDEDNFKGLYNDRLLGFPIRDYEILSTSEINDGVVFEINGKGFIGLEKFEPKVREYYSTTKYDGYSNVDYNDLTDDEILEFGALLDENGYDITVTQTLSEYSSNVKEIKISGTDVDYLCDAYPDVFMNHNIYVLYPYQVRKIIKIMNAEKLELEYDEEKKYNDKKEEYKDYEKDEYDLSYEAK